MSRGLPRVAIVHDYLTHLGGAERVLEALVQAYPQAAVFTLLHSQEVGKEVVAGKSVKTSWLHRVKMARRHHRYFPLLMPLAAEDFDLNGFDIVISATHSFGKAVITPPSVCHVSYCFTPTRYMWDNCHRYIEEFSRLPYFKKIAPVGLSYLRLWDYYAAQRADEYVTLSQAVATRIKKYYGRSAKVIVPPVGVDRFLAKDYEAKDYYLVVSRLVPYKRVDIAIDACEQMGRKLKVVGVGPEEKALRARAGKYTEFLGFVPDEDLPKLYGEARGLLFPQEEDFGLTPLEAAAAGTPTVALSAGGALETIVPASTGVFFQEQSVADLKKAMVKFEARSFDKQVLREHAKLFSKERFVKDIRVCVEDAWQNYKQTYAL